VSVVMILRVPGDPANWERVTQENKDAFLGVAERAKGRGAIHHAFYAGDGEVVVIDEWDSPESFQAFFQDEQETIGSLMQQAGAGEPAPPVFLQKMELGDSY
jgi:hypothetical protein